MSTFTFRRFVLALMGVLVLAACSPAGGSEGSGAEQAVSPYQIVLVSADFAVEEPRISFIVFDGSEAVADISTIRISAIELGEDLSASDQLPAWTGDAASHSDYEVPYWVFYPQIEKAGYWGMVAEITGADGSTTRSDFVVEVREQSKAPGIGDLAPASRNRTLATEPDISLLTSADEPDPDLYQLTVADAIQTGRPTVVGFLTPAFCQTQWCAPVLDSLEAVKSETGDAVNFIHIEVYDDFQELTPVKEMAEWGLDTEPWVFVLDADGRVMFKFSGPLSPGELLTALEELI